MRINVTMRRVLATIFAVEKQYVLHNVSVGVAVVIQQAVRMHRIVKLGLPGCSVFFNIISSKARFSKKKKLLNTKCVFWFPLQLLSDTFLILRRNERDIIKNVYLSWRKVPLFLSDFNENSIFCSVCRKILVYKISWKSVLWERNCSMQTDERTDMTKLVSRVS